MVHWTTDSEVEYGSNVEEHSCMRKEECAIHVSRTVFYTDMPVLFGESLQDSVKCWICTAKPDTKAVLDSNKLR